MTASQRRGSPAAGFAGTGPGPQECRSGDEARRTNAGVRLADGLYHVVPRCGHMGEEPADVDAEREPAGNHLAGGLRLVAGVAR